VLKGVAETLKETLRTHDIPAKFDENQFIVILPETGVENARIVGGRIRELIQRKFFIQKVQLSQAEQTVEEKEGTYTLNGSISISYYKGEKNIENYVLTFGEENEVNKDLLHFSFEPKQKKNNQQNREDNL
jgi:GGDEF domain-containing protein